MLWRTPASPRTWCSVLTKSGPRRQTTTAMLDGLSEFAGIGTQTLIVSSAPSWRREPGCLMLIRPPKLDGAFRCVPWVSTQLCGDPALRIVRHVGTNDPGGAT